jgi:hypothetical protein
MKKFIFAVLASAICIAGAPAIAGTGSLSMSEHQKAHSQKVSMVKQEAMAGATGPVGKIGPGTQPAPAKRSAALHR